MGVALTGQYNSRDHVQEKIGDTNTREQDYFNEHTTLTWINF